MWNNPRALELSAMAGAISADPGKNALKNFSVLNHLSENTGEGAIICMAPMVVPLDNNNKLVPVRCI